MSYFAEAFHLAKQIHEITMLKKIAQRLIAGTY